MTEGVFGDKPKENDDNGNSGVPDSLAGLVGENMKYKTVEEAINSLPHKEHHIGKLETENADFRSQLSTLQEKVKKYEEDLQKSKSIDDILNKMNSNTTEKNTPSNSELDMEKLLTTIDSRMEERESLRVAKENLQTVDSILIQKFGEEKAKELVAKKAEELDVGTEFLKQLAAKSPKAFFQQIGVDTNTNTQNFQSGQHSDINTDVMDRTPSNQEVGTYAFYEKMRKEDPAKWASRNVQIEMMNNLKKLGREKFYNS